MSILTISKISYKINGKKNVDKKNIEPHSSNFISI